MIVCKCDRCGKTIRKPLENDITITEPSVLGGIPLGKTKSYNFNLCEDCLKEVITFIKGGYEQNRENRILDIRNLFKFAIEENVEIKISPWEKNRSMLMEIKLADRWYTPKFSTGFDLNEIENQCISSKKEEQTKQLSDKLENIYDVVINNNNLV